MTAGRRAALLLGCSALLGGLAARDVSKERETIRRAVGDPVQVVVATKPIARGQRLTRRVLGVRSVPGRYAPQASYRSPEALDGLTAAVAIPARTDLQMAMIDDGAGTPGLRAGQRVFSVTGDGEPSLVIPGARVDVVVTSESRPDARVVLTGASVLSVQRATGDQEGSGRRLVASLVVAAGQVGPLAAATDHATVVRLVSRPDSG